MPTLQPCLPAIHLSHLQSHAALWRYLSFITLVSCSLYKAAGFVVWLVWPIGKQLKQRSLRRAKTELVYILRSLYTNSVLQLQNMANPNINAGNERERVESVRTPESYPCEPLPPMISTGKNASLLEQSCKLLISLIVSYLTGDNVLQITCPDTEELKEEKVAVCKEWYLIAKS